MKRREFIAAYYALRVSGPRRFRWGAGDTVPFGCVGALSPWIVVKGSRNPFEKKRGFFCERAARRITGWIDGRNMIIESRVPPSQEIKNLPAFALRKTRSSQPDMLIAPNPPAAVAMKFGNSQAFRLYFVAFGLIVVDRPRPPQQPVASGAAKTTP